MYERTVLLVGHGGYVEEMCGLCVVKDMSVIRGVGCFNTVLIEIMVESQASPPLFISTLRSKTGYIAMISGATSPTFWQPP